MLPTCCVQDLFSIYPKIGALRGLNNCNLSGTTPIGSTPRRAWTKKIVKSTLKELEHIVHPLPDMLILL